MSEVQTLELIARLLAVFAILQSLEFLMAHRWLMTIWHWPVLKKELGGFFTPLLNAQSFYVLNLFRIAVAAVTFHLPNPWFLLILTLLHVLTLLRWLGTFNGGSDYMNLLLLVLTTIGLFNLNDGLVLKVILWWISIQLILSYFKAGWYKLKSRNWRTGFALKTFLTSSVYESHPIIEWLIKSQAAMLILSWIVIVFELSFPIAILSPSIMLPYFMVALIFHLGNAFTFGLNRFVWAWAAAYPALFYCSLQIFH